MTFTTFNNENPIVTSSVDVTVAPDTVRKLRSSRHSRMMRRRSTGCRIIGFGL